MLEKALRDFGLTDKETKVYLAALEMGISSIQELSRKSEVNRATTYIQVESLKNKGLVSVIEKDKKTVIMAEKPQRILEIIDKRKNEVELIEKGINKLMPDLEAIYNVKADRPRVRFMDTQAGFHFFLEDIMKRRPDTLYNLMPQRQQPITEVFCRLVKKIGQLKIVYMLPENTSDTFKRFSNVHSRFYKIDNFMLDILLFQNIVMINKPILQEKKSTAIIIEDKLFFQSFHALFNIFWEAGVPVLNSKDKI